jgi:hypothetical protein
MTPKEKAKKIINLFPETLIEDDEVAKKCALILVDEVLKSLPPYEYGLEFDGLDFVAKIEFWNWVKKEIELL